jgi:hypothetical protein
VLWALATESGRRVRAAFADQALSADGTVAVPEGNAMALHWVRTALVLVLLVVMIYKPGA